jgi:hypothetical protein
VSDHRLGFASIEGHVVGPFGKIHIATPNNRIPIAESRDPEPNPGNDPALLWAGTLPPRPVESKSGQFTIAGKPLFPECEQYLEQARSLRAQACQMSVSVHGAEPLTTPPNTLRLEHTRTTAPN